MFTKKSITPKLLALSVALFSVSVQAAEQHMGDITPWKIGSELSLNQSLFEADFGDLGAGLFATDDPGYDVDTAKGPLSAGHWLRFQPVGTLKFWNGSAWVASVPNGERIEMKDALDKVITFTPAGVSGGIGVIGAADSAGDVHEHVDVSIKDASGALGGTVGAYLVQLNIFESAANSDTPTASSDAPIKIVYNRGLESAAYEAAVSAAMDIDLNAQYEESGKLIIQNVGVKPLQKHYQVSLQLQGDLFVLTEANPLEGHVKTPAPAFYEMNDDLVIPRVKVFGKYYKATLHNVGDFKFKLTSVDEIKDMAGGDHSGHVH